MGRRDYGRHEAKKVKKDTHKPLAAQTSIMPPPPAVEVIGKHKKKRDEGLPEEEK
jgi:hypothetical protein